MSVADPPTPAEQEELFARLIDRGFSFAEIAKLTDRQIADVIFHPRDEQGEIRRRPQTVGESSPRELPPFEKDRLAILQLKSAGVPVDHLIAKWREKHGRPWGV